MADVTVDELIQQALERGIDLGPSPKKVLRFYTKIGFLPEPKRRKVKKLGSTKQFYPDFTIDKLVQIKALKSEGLSIEEIRDSFALEYVQNAIRDLLAKADDNKTRHLAMLISSDKDELEAIVQAPLVYMIEGMMPEEAKKLLTLFCGVGFYALLEAEQSLEEFKFNDAKRALTKAIFYNSIAVLKLARTTGDTNLEEVASKVYEEVVLSPLSKASERVRKDFIDSLSDYMTEKLDKE